MKKEPSGFISAEFSVCLLVSPFGYCSDVRVWCKPVSGAVDVWPLAAFLKLQAIHSLWLILLGFAAHRVGQGALCKANFYQHWVQGCISKCPKLPQDLPLPVSAACLLSVLD